MRPAPFAPPCLVALPLWAGLLASCSGPPALGPGLLPEPLVARSPGPSPALSLAEPQASSSAQPLPSSPRGQADRPRRELGEALSEVTEGSLHAHVAALASDELGGRNPGQAGHEKAARYLEAELERAGALPAGDALGEGGRGFGQRLRVNGAEARNLLAVHPAAGEAGAGEAGAGEAGAGEVMVVGAHYDHLGREGEPFPYQRRRAAGDDEIWNGADDNASGVAVALSLARVFAGGNIACRKTLLFAFFTGEEQGLLASRHYVEHPVAPLGSHALMVNLDMVGRNPQIALTVMTSGLAKAGLAQAPFEAAKKAKLPINAFDMGSRVGDTSDHFPFHRAGVPFVFFWSGEHPDYHRPGDHQDKLDYARMVKVTRTAAHLLSAACGR